VAGVVILLLAGGFLAVWFLSSTAGGQLTADGTGTPPPTLSGETGQGLPPPPAAPAAPASAMPETLEGAIAYVQFWFETLSYTVASGDTRALDAASSPQCRACAAAREVVRDGYRDGARLRGGGYSVRAVTADDFWSTERPALRVVFDRHSRSSVGADGVQRGLFPAGAFLTCEVLLERANGRWRVLEVQSVGAIA